MSRSPVLLLLLVVPALLALGCPASRPMSLPPGDPAVLSSSPVGGGQAADTQAGPVSGLRKDGSACFSSAHCLSNICEGASCDSSRPGTCVPEERACTTDLVEYCGCDGKTFLASSSCPGEAFASRNSCQGELRPLPEDPDPIADDDDDVEEDSEGESEE